VGVPVKYDGPQQILDSMNYNDEANTTQDIVRNMNIMGFGAELFYCDADGIPRFASIDPRESIFVTDDSIEQLLIAYIRVYPKEDEKEGYNVTVYTAVEIIQYTLTLSTAELKQQGQPHRHFFDDVPAIFYPNNPELIGSFEIVMTLQDSLNKLYSDEINLNN
jgi:SPP1 family phage portal protein